MSKLRLRHGSILSGAAAIALAVGFTAPALAQLDEIIVRAQKKSESIQDVPISVTAFDAGKLEDLQIEAFSDLQFNTPSLQYTQGFFGGSGITTLRGIGNLSTAASGEAGVGLHLNEVPLITSRIFEQEFLDIGSVEVLRGPQGTLFGRTATGGTVNVYTATPTDEMEIWGNVQYGNYAQRKFDGGINIPMGENMAARFSGVHLKHKGFVENIAGPDIDGRDMYALRGSLQFTPTSDTTVDLMVGYFEEDSNRSRVSKTLCDRDESGLLGCLPTGLGFEPANGVGSGGSLLITPEILFAIGSTPAALGGLGLSGANAGFLSTLGLGTLFPQTFTNAGTIVPTDLRTVNIDRNPVHETDEFVFTANLKEENLFGTDHDLAIVGGYQETNLLNIRGGSSLGGDMIALTPAQDAAISARWPTTYANYFAGGQFPMSAVTDTLSGVADGSFFSFSNTLDAFDRPEGHTEQWSIEGRIASDYAGPLNWLAGASYLEFESVSQYDIAATSLDYFSIIAGAISLDEFFGAAGAGDGFVLSPPIFSSQTPVNKIDSWGTFGEIYYDVMDNLSLTGGIRFNVDRKSIGDRQFFLNTAVPFGTNTFAGLAAGVIPFDADSETPGAQLLRERSTKFDALTGRVVLDWRPDLGFTDDTLFYGSWSRGFKSGGFNPPIDVNLFGPLGISETFAPETIDAFEIGTKNLFNVNGVAMTANVSGFYYDYEDLQITNIIARSSINENIEAEIFGVEGEFFAALTEALGLNFSFSWLDTSIDSRNGIIDPRDPLQSGGIQRDGFQLVKDFTQGENCAVELNGLPALGASAIFVPGDPALQDLALPLGGFGSCAALDAVLTPAGYTVHQTGLPQDVGGNELPSPDFSFSVGGQYRHTFENMMSLTGRADVYYQNSYFSRIFNRAQDKVDNWVSVNLQATLEPAEGNWYIQGFAQNVTNEDNITFHSAPAQPTSLATTVNVLDPRTWGFQVGARF